MSCAAGPTIYTGRAHAMPQTLITTATTASSLPPRVSAQPAGPLPTARGLLEERDETTYPSPSQLAEFTGNRQADLEGARYDIGTAFPAVLARNPPAAVEIYLRIIEAAVPSPADGLESALFSAGGGTLAGQGHGALLTMTGTIADYLDDLARQDDAARDAAGELPAGPPAADALSDVLGQLTGRLRNLDAWSALLSAGTQRPATLGIRLMPVLCSGQLMRADPASRAAAGLIQAVAPDLGDDEHGRLEAVIVSIPAAGYAGHLRDRLLGALDRARISDPRAKQRLTALDAEGGPRGSKARSSARSGTSRWLLRVRTPPVACPERRSPYGRTSARWPERRARIRPKEQPGSGRASWL